MPKKEKKSAENPARAPKNKTKPPKVGAPAPSALKTAGGDVRIGARRGKRQLTTIGFQDGVLERATRAAEDCGLSRAAWVNLIVKRALKEAGF